MGLVMLCEDGSDNHRSGGMGKQRSHRAHRTEVDPRPSLVTGVKGEENKTTLAAQKGGEEMMDGI